MANTENHLTAIHQAKTHYGIQDPFLFLLLLAGMEAMQEKGHFQAML